jgi:hypothetical protein
MVATPQVTKTGPRSYSPVDNASVLGARLVEPGGPGRIQHAVAGSTRVLGVALADAISPEDLLTTPVLVGGRPVLNAAPLPTLVGVAYGGIETQVEYALAAQEGEWLIAAADGKATPAGATPDARTLVGKCTQPGGVPEPGLGLIRTL